MNPALVVGGVGLASALMAILARRRQVILAPKPGQPTATLDLPGVRNIVDSNTNGGGSTPLSPATTSGVSESHNPLNAAAESLKSWIGTDNKLNPVFEGIYGTGYSDGIYIGKYPGQAEGSFWGSPPSPEQWAILNPGQTPPAHLAFWYSQHPGYTRNDLDYWQAKKANEPALRAEIYRQVGIV